MSRTLRHRLMGLGLLLIFPLAWAIQPYLADGDFTLCFFRTFTGKGCLLCGLTRALAHACRGEFEAAFHYHACWWLAAGLILLAGLFLLTQGRFPHGLRSSMRSCVPLLQTGLLLLLLAYACYQLWA